MIDNLELLADAIVDLAAAQAQAVGAAAHRDLIPRDHPDLLVIHRRAHLASESAGVSLWSVAFELYARGRISTGNMLADEVNAFAARMQDAWRAGYSTGFDDCDVEPDAVVGFDDDPLADATPAVEVVRVAGGLL